MFEFPQRASSLQEEGDSAISGLIVEINEKLSALREGEPQRKQLHDGLLVAQSMLFIKHNETFIKARIAAKDDKAAYDADDFYQRNAAYNADYDFSHKVVRADNGVSFHVDYQTPNTGWLALAGLVYQFETAIVTVREQDRLAELLLALRYDRQRGCIEERISQALIFAGRLASDDIYLDAEFAKIYPLLAISREGDSAKLSCALWEFAGLGMLGKSVLVNETTKFGLVSAGASELNFTPELDSLGHTIYRLELTAALVVLYLKNILRELDSVSEVDYNILIYQEVLAELPVQVTFGKAYPPMVQHRFVDVDDAHKFLLWLQNEPSLQAEQIASAKMSEEGGVYIVRLTGPQFDLILGPNSYERFKNNVPLDVIAGLKNAALVPQRGLGQKQQEQRAREFLQQPSCFKTITGFADSRANAQVVEDMTNSEAKTSLTKAPFRKRRGKDKRFELRLVTQPGGSKKYEVFDTMPEDGTTRVQNYVAWKKEVGGQLPSYHSWTYADPREPDFNPPYFGSHRNHDEVVGMRCSLVHYDLKGRLMEHMRLKAIFHFDRGTYRRPYAFATKLQAQNFLKLNPEGLLLTSLTVLSKRPVKRYRNTLSHNEVLAGFFWRCDGSSQIVAFKDNLQSRLLAQLRALDIQARLEQNPEKYSKPQYGYYPGYQVPVSIWGTGGKNCRLYDKKAQERDLALLGGPLKARVYQSIIRYVKAEKMAEEAHLVLQPLLFEIAGAKNTGVSLKKIGAIIHDIALAEIDLDEYYRKLETFIAAKILQDFQKLAPQDIKQVLRQQHDDCNKVLLHVAYHHPETVPGLVAALKELDPKELKEIVWQEARRCYWSNEKNACRHLQISLSFVGILRQYKPEDPAKTKAGVLALLKNYTGADVFFVTRFFKIWGHSADKLSAVNKCISKLERNNCDCSVEDALLEINNQLSGLELKEGQHLYAYLKAISGLTGKKLIIEHDKMVGFAVSQNQPAPGKGLTMGP